MTIRKGEEWGAPGVLADHGVVVSSDAEARAVVEEHRRSGQDIPPLGVTGGDLWRALGSPEGGERRLREGPARVVPWDLGEILADGRSLWFVSHLVARNSWWRGDVLAIMNVEWYRQLRISPRAHPNDGRLEVVQGNPSFGQRWLARRRLRTGDHLPHPDLAVSRTAAGQYRFERPTRVWLDGVATDRVTTLSVRLEPDAVTIVV